MEEESYFNFLLHYSKSIFLLKNIHIHNALTAWQSIGTSELKQQLACDVTPSWLRLDGFRYDPMGIGGLFSSFLWNAIILLSFVMKLLRLVLLSYRYVIEASRGASRIRILLSFSILRFIKRVRRWVPQQNTYWQLEAEMQRSVLSLSYVCSRDPAWN